jgi:solute carrier family 31 (copper transporter), member 1
VPPTPSWDILIDDYLCSDKKDLTDFKMAPSFNRILSLLSLTLFLHVGFVVAQRNATPTHTAVLPRDSNGMDMTMDDAMPLASGNMLTYLHFTVGGDVLWFQGWVPEGSGPMFGACVGLFLLAMLERWIAACRGVMESYWAKRAQIAYANKLNGNGAAGTKASAPPMTLQTTLLMRRLPPFIFEHDIMRGFMHSGQAALNFAFMLVVMTFQVGFILSIVIGLGVGETLFGRYAVLGGH